MKIQCLIVDDEQPARELLANYIGKVDELELKGSCSNPMEAFAFLQKNKVDLLFLDIQMPKMSGLELIRSLHERPGIIITTAYREFAADGFELDVLDYLVKPVSLDRFLKSLAKYNQYNLSRRGTDFIPDENAYERAYHYFKINKDLVKIFLKDILYIESNKDYIKVVTENRSFITYQRLGYMDEKLPETKFLRIHKSYIVALDKIHSCTHDSVQVKGTLLPVGRSYKQDFIKHLMAV